MNDLADRPRTVAAGDTEEGVLDVAAGGQLLSDHRGGIGGDREPEPDAAGLSGGVGDPGDRGVDADHLPGGIDQRATGGRSEEHTSELQSRGHLVCRLLLVKKKKKIKI